jgi:hypothetical protein
MQIDQALQILNAKFKYKYDKRYFDKWTILSDLDGWEGDCEDYSLTLCWMLSNQSMVKLLWNILTFKYLFWYTLSPSGSAHAVVRVGGLYYDNIQKKGVTAEALKDAGYVFKFPLVSPIVFLKMIAASTIGKIV